MYNYFEAVKADVKNYIAEEYSPEKIRAEWAGDREGFEEHLNDELWTVDSVTGNGSGSYTFSTYQAEQNLLGNWAEIEEAADAFGIEPVVRAGYENGPEWWDVAIRCYHLPAAIAAALDEIEEENPGLFEALDEDEDSTTAA